MEKAGFTVVIDLTTTLLFARTIAAFLFSGSPP
jgi:hypothetical protein